jgi:hypothetical protein
LEEVFGSKGEGELVQRVGVVEYLDEDFGGEEEERGGAQS